MSSHHNLGTQAAITSLLYGHIPTLCLTLHQSTSCRPLMSLHKHRVAMRASHADLHRRCSACTRTSRQGVQSTFLTLPYYCDDLHSGIDDRPADVQRTVSAQLDDNLRSLRQALGVQPREHACHCQAGMPPAAQAHHLHAITPKTYKGEAGWIIARRKATSAARELFPSALRAASPAYARSVATRRARPRLDT